MDGIIHNTNISDARLYNKRGEIARTRNLLRKLGYVHIKFC